METNHCTRVQSLSHLQLCYRCLQRPNLYTQILTTRKGNTWVHLRSPRWAMLSWYFTWKDRIGYCLWTWVNICVCCQNKNRRAQKQNKSYMGAMPGGLNKEREMRTCSHALTLHTPTAHLFSLYEKNNSMRESSLATLIKICDRWGTRSELQHFAYWEILPQRNHGRHLDY